MTIYKNSEGTLIAAYVGMNVDDYEIATEQDFIDAVSAADMWGDIEPEIYRSFLDDVDLDYDRYDDPDELWEEYIQAVAASKKPYLLFDDAKTDIFTERFETKEELISAFDSELDHWTPAEREKRVLIAGYAPKSNFEFETTIKEHKGSKR